MFYKIEVFKGDYYEGYIYAKNVFMTANRNGIHSYNVRHLVDVIPGYRLPDTKIRMASIKISN